jgi:hypothetical protein
MAPIGVTTVTLDVGHIASTQRRWEIINPTPFGEWEQDYQFPPTGE